MLENVFIHPTAVVDQPCEIGAGTKIWHFCHVMAHAQIGPACVLGQNVLVAGGVRLGRGVRVQNNVSLYTGVVCEDEVFIGPSAVFTNVRNPRGAISRKHAFRETWLAQGVTIGANATLVCGVRLGAYAFVGAGSVVTRDVLPYALVTGNPARHVGWMSAVGERLHFDGNGLAVCAESGEEYLLSEAGVQRLDARG